MTTEFFNIKYLTLIYEQIEKNTPIFLENNFLMPILNKELSEELRTITNWLINQPIDKKIKLFIERTINELIYINSKKIWNTDSPIYDLYYYPKSYIKFDILSKDVRLLKFSHIFTNKLITTEIENCFRIISRIMFEFEYNENNTDNWAIYYWFHRFFLYLATENHFIEYHN